MRALDKMHFETPSPVQAESITPLLNHEDVLVLAPTGTGKTAAFGIPLIENTEPKNEHIQSVILCPTRELALQTTAVLRKMSSFKPGIRITALYGGEPISHQIGALKRRPQIIVATPGRLLDHIKRRTTRLDNVKCVVLDEADRMLDMGFRDDMNAILDKMPAERQTALFSATMSKEIVKIATEYQTDPTRITIEKDLSAEKKIKQYYFEAQANKKTSALVELIKEKEFGLSLVFVATKSMADKLSLQLTNAGYPAEALHGDLRQVQRDKVMKRYRDGKTSILVATDVAARGIDVDGIDAVINYDIPGDPDSYVHRIGRTGRADSSGAAYTFIYSKERGRLRDIIAGTHMSISPVSIAGNASPVCNTSERRSPSSRNSNSRGSGSRNQHSRSKGNNWRKKERYAS